jgi:crotonobetainyl-CoA:carnitine CoA-transferase CaiB-like acyl-CoA transferase
VNLARVDDRALLPAWLGFEAAGDGVWPALAARVRTLPARDVVARARLLGLPAAVAAESPESAARGIRTLDLGPTRVAPADRALRVVDLSSLWAGPLCAQLLGLAGARVVKVESTRRPDGARAGEATFFDLLNAGKASAAFDLERDEGWERLRSLLDAADVVIESARPRALVQRGIQAERWVAARPGRTWVAISGYGRREPGCDWVAFGDDAAVAGGLVSRGRATKGGDEELHFSGDAIADPLTGLHAAVGALGSWRSGGGQLLDVSMRDLVAELCGAGEACGEAEVRPGPGETGWEVVLGEIRAPVRAPRARVAPGRAAPLGADTATILREWAC